jgi:hypothetical protein
LRKLNEVTVAAKRARCRRAARYGTDRPQRHFFWTKRSYRGLMHRPIAADERSDRSVLRRTRDANVPPPLASQRSTKPDAAVEPTKLDPIFIIGTGRCGSTAFHDLLTLHPDVTWLSDWNNRFPDRPELNRTVLRCHSIPGARRLLRHHWHPVEAYRFWDYYYPGFSMPFRDLTAEDAMPAATARLQAAAAACVSPRRPHLLSKITGWPRLGFLNAVYPNARFISVIRDGRATAGSLLRVKFWAGWRGPEGWGWGPLSPAQNERWKSYGQSFVALAALQWEILMQAYERAKQLIPPSRLLEIRYEQLCADPLGVTRHAAQFAELEPSAGFERSVRGFRMANQNHKWREGLTSTQQAQLSECISECLQRWGY